MFTGRQCLLVVLGAIFVLTAVRSQPKRNLAYSMFRWTWLLTSAKYRDSTSNFVLSPYLHYEYLNELYSQGDDEIVNEEIEKTLDLKGSGYQDSSQLREDIRIVAKVTNTKFLTFYEKNWQLDDRFKHATQTNCSSVAPNLAEADFSTASGRQDVLDKLNAAIAEVDTEPNAIKKVDKALSNADVLVQGGPLAANLKIKTGFVPAKQDSFVGRFYNNGVRDNMVTLKYGLKRMTVPYKLDTKLNLHIVGVPLDNDWYVFFNVPVKLDGLRATMAAENVDQYISNFIEGVYPTALDIYVPFSEKANDSSLLKPDYQETGIKHAFEKSAKLKFFAHDPKSAHLANMWIRGDHRFCLEDINIRTVSVAEFQGSEDASRAHTQQHAQRPANLSAAPSTSTPSQTKQAPGTIQISRPDHLVGQDKNARVSKDNRMKSASITIVPDHPYSYIVLDNYNIPVFSGVVQVGRPAADNDDQSWPN
ncbi:hypothetical protein HDE_03855 [Halotydeus destructor]|nr:hypothetical protein HDE_03855 [Halotydeus destructor]